MVWLNKLNANGIQVSVIKSTDLPMASTLFERLVFVAVTNARTANVTEIFKNSAGSE